MFRFGSRISLRFLFPAADNDGDGRVGPTDAKVFYGGSGLPKPVLSKIWRAATNGAMKSISTIDDFRRSLR